MIALVVALGLADDVVGAARPGDSVRIEWNAPASCPSSERLAEGLAHGLRRAPEQPIRVVADVTAIEHGFVAEVVVDTAWGTSRRHIEATECTAIADTTLLIAVIAADPLAIALGDSVPVVEPIVPLQSEPSTPSETIAASTPAPSPFVAAPRTEITPTHAPAPRGRRGRVRGVVRLEGAFGLAIVPQPSGAFGGAIAAQWRHAELGVAALWWPARATPRTASGASASIGLVGIGPYGCGFLARYAWSLGLCGSIEAGVMTGRGHDVDRARGASRPWLGLAAGPRVRWSPHPRVGLVLGVEGVAVAWRPRFVIADEGDLHLTRIAGFRTRLGIEVRWP